MVYRAIDIHTHFRTGERRESAAQHADAERLFGAGAEARRDEDPVDFFRQRELMAVVFDIDAESADGQKMSNDEIVRLVSRSEGRLIGFASVDPWKGRAAVRELERCATAGLRGLKVQPITQSFWLNDDQFRPLWDACQSLGLPVIVHTGTTGIGAGAPGGRGLQLKYGHPLPGVDDLAARFPRLTIIASHFAWPWHLDLLAIARQKGNVYIDLSGWAPKYIPPEVVQQCNSVMPEKFLFGSDFPLFGPDRWLTEFEGLELREHVRSKVLYENACRILNLDPGLFTVPPATGGA